MEINWGKNVRFENAIVTKLNENNKHSVTTSTQSDCL